MRIAVIGATGNVGTAVLTALGETPTSTTRPMVSCPRMSPASMNGPRTS